MKDEIKKLITLALIDQEIDSLNEELGELPIAISEINAQLKNLQANFENKKNEIISLTKEKTGKELELNEQKDWLSQRETRTKDLKTNKEYHSALKEVTQTKKAIGQVEESIKSLTARLEEENTKIGEIEKSLADEKSKLEGLVAEKTDQIEAVKEKLAGKVEARGQEEIKVQEAILKRYKIIKGRIAPALSLADQGACVECNTRIPPQMFIEIQKFEQLLTCPRCHRILYAE